MQKIVVLSCTNRPNSNTLKVSKIYEDLILSKKIDVQLLDLCNLSPDFSFTESFGNRSENFANLIHNFITSTSHFVFVIPEYNGSFPGILKSFIDAIPPKEWANKKANLVGLSAGRAGNLRGLEHLTGILQYLKMHVYHNKLPISLIDKLINADGNFIDDLQKNACEEHLNGFLEM